MAKKFEKVAYYAVCAYLTLNTIIGFIGIMCCNIKFNVHKNGLSTVYSTLNRDSFVLLLVIGMYGSIGMLIITLVIKGIIEKIEELKDWYVERRRLRAERTLRRRLEMK